MKTVRWIAGILAVVAATHMIPGIAQNNLPCPNCEVNPEQTGPFFTPGSGNVANVAAVAKEGNIAHWFKKDAAAAALVDMPAPKWNRPNNVPQYPVWQIGQPLPLSNYSPWNWNKLSIGWTWDLTPWRISDWATSQGLTY